MTVGRDDELLDTESTTEDPEDDEDEDDDEEDYEEIVVEGRSTTAQIWTAVMITILTFIVLAWIVLYEMKHWNWCDQQPLRPDGTRSVSVFGCYMRNW